MEQMLARLLLSMGFDADKVKAQMETALNDLHSMKLAQDRIEATTKETKLSDFAQYAATAPMSDMDRLMVITHIREFQRYGFSKVAS